MPIEIRELVIKVKVNEQPPAAQPLRTTESRENQRKDVEDAVITEAVQQVMQILKDQKER